MPTAESSATSIIGSIPYLPKLTKNKSVSYCQIAGGEIKVVRVGVGSRAHFRYKDNITYITYIWGSMQ